MSDIKPNTPAAPQKPTEAKTEAKAGTIGGSDLESLIKRISEEMLSVSIATASAMRPAAPAPSGHQARDFGPKCGTCGQYETACQKKHVDFCAYPTNYPEFGEFFQGIMVNGVRYLSNGPGHTVKIPAVSEAEFANIIRTYEHNERESRVGRSKVHNSGSVFNPQPANAAWR
jgi:hypothetical protein